jgi:hypothetical protein
VLKLPNLAIKSAGCAKVLVFVIQLRKQVAVAERIPAKRIGREVKFLLEKKPIWRPTTRGAWLIHDVGSIRTSLSSLS